MWKVLHEKIDGAIIDRERGYPHIELEMHPTSKAYPDKPSNRELHIRIGGSHTVLYEVGIEKLVEFLKANPSG